MRAGEFLKKRLACSAKLIARLKKDERGIVLNGSRITVRAVLHAGDLLEISEEDRAEDVNEDIIPCGEMPKILYEDEDIIAVDKPAFMPTHPSHGHYDDTLANALAKYFSDAGTPFVFRAMNRLDRNTSGIVVVSKNRLSAARLSSAMANGEVRKRYFAVTCGIPEQKSGMIETDFRRTAESIITREAFPIGEGGDGAQYAATEYTVISEKGGRAGIIVSPLTGRTHQIRVHMRYIGTPLLGDDLYGEPSDLINRHALHAFSLEFPHKEKTLRLLCPPPNDLLSLAGIDDETLNKKLLK